MKHSITALAMLVAMTGAAQTPALKIYKGERRSDTVYVAKQYVIGVTDPGATATIEGKDAHVYRTGSFGAEVMLKPGENKIPVEVKLGKKKAKAEVRYVYLTKKPTPKPVANAGAADNDGHFIVSDIPEQTAPLAKPVNIYTKEGAYLQYGNGGDRLGGSKMNFIDADIPLTAVGETANLYKVALGESHFAYIPKSSTEAGGPGFNIFNTGSVSVANIGKCDRITVSLPGRLPYWTRSEIDPSTILVSVYGATNNTNWLTQNNTPEMIKYVDLRQDASDVLTFVIRLNDEYQWGYSTYYNGSNLIIDVRHRPASLELADLTIGLDAGHGGAYPGAHSPSGLTEKEVNLDIVLKAADLLRKEGAKVVMTRDGDTGPSMTERKQIWREGNVDLAVSVHNNASGNPLTPMGTSAYYKHISNRALAQDLHESMLTLGVANFGLTGNFNFSLNGPTEYPNALVEALFMSSLPEEELLADPDYRTRMAEKVVAGIKNYLERVKASLK